MKLDLQLFGGRGAKSSRASKSSNKATSTANKYENRNIDSYREWWEDNVDNLADNFEAKYNKPPVNPNTGTTNSKWDDFAEKEYEKAKKEVEAKQNTTSKEDKELRVLKHRLALQRNAVGRKDTAEIKRLEGETAKLQTKKDNELKVLRHRLSIQLNSTGRKDKTEIERLKNRIKELGGKVR